MRLVAKTQQGLEEILVKELEQLGAADIEKLYRAVAFEGDLEMVYRANLHLRTALKILKPVHTFQAKNETELYEGTKQFDWSTLMEVDGTLSLDAAVNSPFFNHSKYASLKVKDAIVDQFRDKFGKRPNVELIRPYLRLNVHISGIDCTISIDSTGDSLHKRGYKTEINLSPLNEVLAAGMVQLSGWDGKSNFIDPMCGSGTILIEAAMYALNIPPGLYRQFYAFMKWPDFDQAVWDGLIEKGREGIIRDFPFQLYGSDISRRTIEIASTNVTNAFLDEDLRLQIKPMQAQEPPSGGGVCIMNPPYGERMVPEDINGLYKEIGDTMKKNYAGYDVWILSGNPEAMKHIGLRPTRKIPLLNGSLECKFMKFTIYEGTKKTHKLNSPAEPEENREA